MMLHLHSILVILLIVPLTLSLPDTDSESSEDQGKSVGSTPNPNINKHNVNKVFVEESPNKEIKVDTHVNSPKENSDVIHENRATDSSDIDSLERQSSLESHNADISTDSHKDMSSDTMVFEESGGEEEKLVDQMKRLSEKIKNREKEMQQEQRPNSDIELEYKRGMEDHKTETIKTLNTGVHRQTDKNIPPVQDFPNSINTEMENFEAEDKPQGGSKSIGRKTLTDKIKDDVEYFNLENYAADQANLENDESDEDFPDESDYDLNEPSEHLEPSVNIPISNTLPPLSDIIPSQTEIQQSATVQSSESMTADEVMMSSNPTINDIPQDTPIEFVKIEISLTDVTMQTTSIPDESIASSETPQSTAFLGIKNVGKNYRLGKKTAEKQKTTAGQQDKIDSTARDEVKAHDQIETENIQRREIYPTGTVKHFGFTATEAVSNDKDEAYIDTSDTPLDDTVLETATMQQFYQEKKDEDAVNNEKDEEKLPSQTASATESPEESEVPSITQTVSEEDIYKAANEDQDDQAGELSEEEKQKTAQAQQYFEQGEKLVNNSYKKDYIQAYEYFKLAADLGHMKAQEYLGFGYLLGDYISLDPGKALKIFTELGEKGSPRGQLGLGFCYGSGLAVNSSQAKALIYFTFAALGGDPFGQMVLGYRYLSGIGVESKCETALQFYRKVATTGICFDKNLRVAENTSSGSPVIQRIRLHEQADNKDSGSSLMDADLLQYYEFLADKGDLQAQVVLGQLYYQGGRGVPINHERAHHYFLMASESGNANAFAFLGKMHSEGSPYIKQDNITAYQFFKKAADKGNPIGLCGLGTMHFHGRGVDKDYVKALKYFTQSADQGWSDGQLQLGLMHYSGKGVKRDYKQAVRYFNLASQGGHVLAFFHLAQMHATGIGVLRNCHTAVELYKNVAERGPWASKLMEAHQLYKEGNVNEALLKYTFLAELGYEVAQTNVAYILDQGESSLFTETETYQRALLQWTRAASQGSTMARLKMGDYHYYGYGTEIDYETAASHYRMATEQQHNAQAMFNLGYMHEKGLGLKQDIHLAKRFYDMAAETSGDAYVPVTLALIKMGLFYGVDVFNKELEGYNDVFKRIDIRYQLGPNWDIYLATFLAIVLGIVVVIRRQR